MEAHDPVRHNAQIESSRTPCSHIAIVLTPPADVLVGDALK